MTTSEAVMTLFLTGQRGRLATRYVDKGYRGDVFVGGGGGLIQYSI